VRRGEDRGVHRVLVGKPEGKRPLGRPRRRWEDNIKMDVQDCVRRSYFDNPCQLPSPLRRPCFTVD
jgi:hypothetical protein